MGFLTQFKRFMLMNQQASIAQDPICKASYFLSLMGGPKVDAWILRQYEWLDEIDDDPNQLPHNMNAWQVLEAEFKQAFINYAIHK